MSKKTPVSELNVKMGIDASPLEKDVPKIEGLMKRVKKATTAAAAAQVGGGDPEAMSKGIMTRAERVAAQRIERLRKQQKDVSDASAFEQADPFTQQTMLAQKLNEIMARRDALAENTVERERAHLEVLKQQAALTRLRTSLTAPTDFKAEQQAARAQEEARRASAEQRLALERQIESVRKKGVEVSRQSSFENANGFRQQTMLASEVNRLVIERRRVLQESGRDSVAFANAELVLRQRIAQLRDIRSGLTAPTDFKAEQQAARAQEEAAEQRLALERQIASIKEKGVDISRQSRFENANGFRQQTMLASEVNRLVIERRRVLQESGRESVAFANAELVLRQRIAQLRNLRNDLTAGVGGFTKLGTTAADSQKKFAQFGLAMQQSGYQIQDFAVQVASGTNALVALSQQGSQLLSFFGGWKGAVAGAVLAVGVLAYRVYDMSKGMSAAKKETENLTEALKRYREVKEGREAVTVGDAEKRRLETEKKRAELVEKQRIAGESYLSLLKRQQALLERGRRGGSGARAAGVLSTQISRQIEELKQLRKQITALQTAQSVEDDIVLMEERRRRSKELSERGAEERAYERSVLPELEKINALKQEIADYPVIDNSDIERVNALLTELNQLERSVEERRKSTVQSYRDMLDPLANVKRQLEEVTNLRIEKHISPEEEDAIHSAILEPLRESVLGADRLKKKLEEIARLQNAGIISENEAIRARMKLAEERERSLKIPSALETRSGAFGTGGRMSSGTSTELVNINRKMLEALRTLVQQGNN